MPYKSKAQAAYFNIHKKELESKGVNVDEYNAASKGKKLPGHVGDADKATEKAPDADEKKKKKGKDFGMTPKEKGK